MNIQKTIDSLKRNGYAVSYFETGVEAVAYLRDNVKGKTIGFGGSQTLTDLDLRHVLAEENTVYVPDFPKEGENFFSTAMNSMTTDLYFLSANAMSENGEIVNIDAGGNRLAGSVWGHKKVYFVVGTNKIEESLDKAVWRARNIAGPMNCRRFGLKTPCAVGEVKCHDCHSPQRLCNGMMVHLHRVGGETAVVSTHETLQYDDYSKYVGDYKLDIKNEIHATQYPIDCQSAFDMGARLIE